MARIDVATDARGTKKRDLGWEPDNKGGYRQHRFYLGRDRAAAVVRALLLEKVWQAVERKWADNHRRGLVKTERPTWNTYSLAIAMAIAHGDNQVEIEPQQYEAGLEPDLFSRWFDGLCETFAGCGVKITLAGEDQKYASGQADNEREAEIHEGLARAYRRRSSGAHTLHQALDRYAEWLRQEHKAADGLTSMYGTVASKEAVRLRDNIADRPLTVLDTPAIDDWITFWRLRPSKRNGKQTSIRSASNQIKRIRHFIRWLHKQPAFDWRKPLDYEVRPQRIPETPAETAARRTPHQVTTYTLEELQTLYEYATPLMRLYMLLALNAGMGSAEIATLQVSDIQDGHIRRVRYKSKVYGEWRAWPQTLLAIEWALKRRPESTHTELVLSKQGEPIHTPTEGRNRRQTIPNAWTRLYARITKDKKFRKLSFNKLRKTAANLVRRYSDGETAAVFLCHGQPVSDDLLDDYTDRNFEPVFWALERVHAYLEPLWKAVPDPFPAADVERHPEISLGTIRRIRELHQQGYRVSKIAEITGASMTTVRRYRR